MTTPYIYANSSTNNESNSDLAAQHFQITQTASALIASPHSISLKDLQTVVTLAQKYFLSRKAIELPLFNQRLEAQRLRRYYDNSSYREPQPFIEQKLLAVFQQYISTHSPTNRASNGVAKSDIVTLTQLRNLLRQLQEMNNGHLSGPTWLYDSPLPPFAAQHLKPLDQQIIETSLASGAALCKKRQYSKAIKLYKTLLADYVNSPPAASLKVLLDATIVEDYNYRAKRALAKHDYKTAAPH